MLLVTPEGTRVNVRADKGERLKKLGWKEPQSETAEALPPAPKKRGRPKKVTTEDQE